MMKSDPTISRKITPELLSLCACPKCKGHLTHNESDDSLECIACRVNYRITAGIPILLQHHGGARE